MNEAAHKELYEAARQGRLRKREDGVYWPRENLEVYCGYQIVRDFILDQDPIYLIVAGIAESWIDCSAWNQKRDSAPDLNISRGPFCTLDETRAQAERMFVAHRAAEVAVLRRIVDSQEARLITLSKRLTELEAWRKFVAPPMPIEPDGVARGSSSSLPPADVADAAAAARRALPGLSGV